LMHTNQNSYSRISYIHGLLKNFFLAFKKQAI